LEEVLKYKKEKINHKENIYYENNLLNYLMENPKLKNNKNLDEINILECFDYEEKINYCQSESQIFCNYCKVISDCYMNEKLFTGPEILILILNRGKEIKFNLKLYFTEELDLSKYIENKESGYMYKLIGVITHLGKINISWHFIAYCKDPLNGKWYKYNDDFVDEVKDFKKEVIDLGMPYLLFYEKIKNPK